MALTIGQSIASLMAQRELGRAGARLQTASERLSSGMRINRPGDDPAGSAVASLLQTDSRVMGQAVRNVNDGISLLSVAEAALQELRSILERQGELAEQAANGVCTTAQRRVLQQESDALVEEFNRIINTTEFNGIKLLDGSRSEVQLQAGAGVGGSISFEIAEELTRTTGDGTFSAAVSLAVSSANSVRDVELIDVNKDGKLDLVATLRLECAIGVALGNGDGTFGATAAYATGERPHGFAAADFDGDGNIDLVTRDGNDFVVSVFRGRGDGTFDARTSYGVLGYGLEVAAGDLNGDGHPDLVAELSVSDKQVILINQGNGTFAPAVSVSEPGKPVLVDLDRNGTLDLLFAVSSSLQVLLGRGDGTFQTAKSYDVAVAANTRPYMQVADIDRDGNLDAVVIGRDDGCIRVMLGQGDGTFSTGGSYAAGANAWNLQIGDLDGDGLLDVAVTNYAGGSVSVLRGQGDASFSAPVSYAVGAKPPGIAIGDINRDGGSDIVTANFSANTVTFLLADVKAVATMPLLNMCSQQDALESIDIVSTTMQRISAELGNIGAMQSRLAHTVSYLQVMRENFTAANSRIVDADVAGEVAQMVRAQVLQQAATAVIAQMNQTSELVLQLLK